MTSGDIIAIVAMVLIIGGAVAYIIKAKKSGKKCIGCPDSSSCSGKCSSCSCGCMSSTSAPDDLENQSSSQE
ncbi:MAG: FeoB-associated Cys-rich membrane protein [Clostridia bacterium]|nr:FeoB-associated Cys-rich membrane protein [Clostridia bacterium]